jgi:hypothetical protein
LLRRAKKPSAPHQLRARRTRSHQPGFEDELRDVYDAEKQVLKALEDHQSRDR